MAINRNFFDNVLKDNIVEVKWVRRLPKSGYALSRRALATNSVNLLNSELGVKILNFRPPTQLNPLNQSALNLVTYWDIFRQDYRNSSCESLQMIKIWPLTTPQEINRFWIYFRDVLRDMTPQQKIEFMNT